MFALFLYHPSQLISKELLIYLALQDTKTKSQISKTQRFGHLLYVRLIGLEPTRLATPDPKSGVATNYTTGAVCSGKVTLFWRIEAGTRVIFLTSVIYSAAKWRRPWCLSPQNQGRTVRCGCGRSWPSLCWPWPARGC